MPGVLSPGRYRPLWIVVYPLIVGNLAAVALTVADGAVLGRFSTRAVAAVGLAAPVALVATMLASGWATGVQVLVSRHSGAGEGDEVERVTDVSAALGVSIGLVVGMVVAVISSPLMHAITDDAALASTSARYLQIVAVGFPLAGGMTALRSALGGLGLTKVTMRAAIGVNLLNIPLDIVLVYGLGLGASGAALGTVFALGATFAVLAWYTWRRLPAAPRTPHLRDWRGDLSRLWRIGWPETVMLTSGYLSSAIVGGIVAGLGITALAAWSILGRVLPVLWTVIYACSSGIAIVVGQRLGAGDAAAADSALRSGWVITGGLAALLTVPVVVVPDLVFGLFSNDPDVVGAAVGARLYLFGQAPLMVAGMVYAGALRAAGDTRAIMIAGTVASYLFSLPVSWLLATRFGLGLPGIYLGQLGYWVIRTAITRYRFAAGAWRTTAP